MNIEKDTKHFLITLMLYVPRKHFWKNMKINFGLHLGFAITRYPEPEKWTKIVEKELGTRHVQFISTYYLLNYL